MYSLLSLLFFYVVQNYSIGHFVGQRYGREWHCRLKLDCSHNATSNLTAISSLNSGNIPLWSNNGVISVPSKTFAKYGNCYPNNYLIGRMIMELKSKKILLMDDNPRIRSFNHKGRGYHPHRFADGVWNIFWPSQRRVASRTHRR